MKRRSHSYTCLLFMLCGVLAGACTAPDADTPDTPEAYNEPEILSPSDIPAEEALQDLISTLEDWSENSLRSAEGIKIARMLKSTRHTEVSAVKAVYTRDSSLRDASGRSNAKNSHRLMHLVNFDGGGYAVLSADRRIPSSILAIVDEGSVSEADFLPIEEPEGEITLEQLMKEEPGFVFYNDSAKDCCVATQMYLNRHPQRMLYAYASAYAGEDCGRRSRRDPKQRLQTVPDYYAEPGYECGDATYITRPGRWVTTEEVPVMLKTVWGQGYPFNTQTPWKPKWLFGPKAQAPAGCVPIAVGQILTYVKPFKPFYMNEVKIDFDLLESIYNVHRPSPKNRLIGVNPGSPEEFLGGYFLRQIGHCVGAWYFAEFTFAFPFRVKDYFKNWLFLPNVQRHWCENKQPATIKALKNGTPVFISAISGWKDGHAWVIDGYRLQERTDMTIDARTGRVVSSNKTSRTLVHCNFGWTGTANGYYTFDAFNTTSGPEEISWTHDRFGGDRDDSNFKLYVSVITFDKPRT